MVLGMDMSLYYYIGDTFSGQIITHLNAVSYSLVSYHGVYHKPLCHCNAMLVKTDLDIIFR